MRKTAIFIIIVHMLTSAMLTGCGADEQAPDADMQDPGASGQSHIEAGEHGDTTEPPLSFSFEARNVAIVMGAPASPAIDALGEPLSYFEAPSCAFDGIDKIYYFPGFELYTYPVDGEDFILSVNLTDDNVTTKEGVYLGMSRENMLDAYGSDYILNHEQYIYTRGDSTLSFLIDNGEIAVIIYNYTNVPVY